MYDPVMTSKENWIWCPVLCAMSLLVANAHAQDGSFRIKSMDMSVSATAYTRFYSLEDASQIIKEISYSYQESVDETAYRSLNPQLLAGFSESRANASSGYVDDRFISFSLFGATASRGLGTLGEFSGLPAYYGVPNDTPYKSYATVTIALLIEFDLLDTTDLLLSFFKAGGVPGRYYFEAHPDEVWPAGSDLPSADMRLALQRLDGGDWVDVFQRQASEDGVYPEHIGEEYPVFASTFAQSGTYRLMIEGAAEGSEDGVVTPSIWAEGGLYFTQIPEPGSAVLLLFGMLVCAWPRHRRA